MSIFSKIGSLDQSKPYAQIYLQIIASCINWTQMDPSKAYDRVNHWTLFRKLLKRSVSIIVVRMLLFWYSKQVVCIRWELRYRHILILVMEYDREEYYLYLYLLYTWMIFLHCSTLAG